MKGTVCLYLCGGSYKQIPITTNIYAHCKIRAIIWFFAGFEAPGDVIFVGQYLFRLLEFG
jgi:hypothetical protein